MPSARLRGLQIGDIEAAREMAAAFHAESWYRDMDLSLSKIDGLVQQALANPAWFCVVAADSVTDRAVGYMMAIAAPHYFGNDLQVTDLGLYLSPDYRKMSLAIDMVRQMEKWAAAVGAKEITLGVSSGVADARIVRLYERLGYAKGFYGVHKKSR